MRSDGGTVRFESRRVRFVALAAALSVGVGLAGVSSLASQGERAADATGARGESSAAVDAIDIRLRGVRVEAVTRPSGDAELGFTINGRVAAVLVEQGAEARAGDALVRLDDRVARLERDQLAARAESTAQLDAARAQLELARADLERVQSLVDDNVAGPYELQRQRLTVAQAEASVAIQEEARRLAQLRLEAAEQALDEYALRTPIDGRVELVTIDEGEPATALRPVVRVVRTDPLRVEASAPTAATLALKPGDPAWVMLRVDAQRRVLPGRVVSLAAVADAASNTRRVRIEADNPDDLPAGSQATVSFEPPDADGPDLRGSER